ncbi:hypothetical protein R1sor_000592 [Riccia sorocarpa]|uniref:Uncharacterized protein n=1 Tax=Riccia sorocarpa TaxID=122646 RepID=A0ABD3GWS0_9MARC
MVDVLDIEEVFFDPWQKGRYFNENKPEQKREGPKSPSPYADVDKKQKRKDKDVRKNDAAKGKRLQLTGSSNEASSSSSRMIDVANREKRMQEDLDILLAFTEKEKKRNEYKMPEERIPVEVASSHCQRELEVTTKVKNSANPSKERREIGSKRTEMAATERSENVGLT